jgi:hypothetical protein
MLSHADCCKNVIRFRGGPGARHCSQLGLPADDLDRQSTNNYSSFTARSQARPARLLSPDALAMVRLVENLKGLARVAP